MKIYVDPYDLMSDELCHYGVKGQQKGVRRYQYTDGRLTPEGYIHYGISKKENTGKGVKYLLKTPKYGLASYGLHALSTGATGAAAKAASIPVISKTASAKAVAAGLAKASEYAAIGSTAALAIVGAEALAGLGLIAHAKYSGYKVKQSSELDRIKYEEEQTQKQQIAEMQAQKTKRKKPTTAVVHSDLINSDVIIHFGIPDMKWGRRRWQNPDGSLTLAGYEHYGYTKRGVLTKKGKKYEEKRIKKMDLKDSQKESIKDKANAIPKENTVNNKEAEKQFKQEQKQQKKKEKLYNKGQLSAGQFTNDETTKYYRQGEKAINSIIDTVSTNNYVKKADRDLLNKYKDLSTKELQEIVNRELTETAYLAAREQRSKYSKKRRAGKQFVSTAANAAVIVSGIYFTKKAFDALNMNHSDLIDEDFLAHFGIRGQKWGIRRYQNPDGSLTPEGRIHYGVKGTKSGWEADRVAESYNKEGKYYHLHTETGWPGSSPTYYIEEYKGDPKNLKPSSKSVQDERIEKYKQERINENKAKLEEAKNKDIYELNFLETIQSDYREEPGAPNTKAIQQWRLNEYRKYLEDREKYMQTFEAKYHK